MKCPNCGSTNYTVVDSRVTGETIRRRRECGECHNRWTTAELEFNRYVQLRKLEPLLIDMERIVNKSKKL